MTHRDTSMRCSTNSIETHETLSIYTNRHANHQESFRSSRGPNNHREYVDAIRSGKKLLYHRQERLRKIIFSDDYHGTSEI